MLCSWYSGTLNAGDAPRPAYTPDKILSMYEHSSNCKIAVREIELSSICV